MVPCEFPFKFKGKTYNGCINFVDIKNGQQLPGDPWCSTKVSGSDREHVTGGRHYGECHNWHNCPGWFKILDYPIYSNRASYHF